MIDQEILADFQAESKGLLDELENVVELLEDAEGEFPDQELAHFAQRIDRIMGAAQTMTMLEPSHQGLARIGAIAQVCKKTGYRAAMAKRADLVPLFAAFWADTIEILRELIDNVGDEAKSAEIANSSAKSLLTRLTWLSEKLGKEAEGDQIQLESFLRQLENK